MKHLFKSLTSVILCMAMVFSVSATAFAAEEIDPYTVEGKYVQELVELDENEIKALPLEEAKELFEEAFAVSSVNYSEDEIRLALDGWAFALKIQVTTSLLKEAASSTTADKKYYGSIGLVWTRDTTSGGSPLTLGEILSGAYTLEVDYISWKSAATILAASADYDVFQDLVDNVAAGAAGTVLSEIIFSALNITGLPATIGSTIVGVAVGMGWNWLKSIDRDRMLDCFEDMDEDDFMRVQFMWASNMVNRFYEVYTPSSYNFENPFPGTYGTWRTGTYGYLYSY